MLNYWQFDIRNNIHTGSSINFNKFNNLNFAIDPKYFIYHVSTIEPKAFFLRAQKKNHEDVR